MTNGNILTKLKKFGDCKMYRAFCSLLPSVMCLTCICESINPQLHMSVSCLSGKSKTASGSGASEDGEEFQELGLERWRGVDVRSVSLIVGRSISLSCSSHHTSLSRNRIHRLPGCNKNVFNICICTLVIISKQITYMLGIV